MVKEALLDALRRRPEGVAPDEIDKFGIADISAVTLALNAALAERSVGVFQRKAPDGSTVTVLRILSGEQHLATLSYVCRSTQCMH